MKRKFNTKNIAFIIGLLLFTMSFVFTLIGVGCLVSKNQFMKTAKSTEAKIVDITIEQYRSSRGKHNSDYDAWVEYYVDGEKYEQKLNEYSSSMYIGQNMEIFYDPENPNKIMRDSYVLEIVFISVGGLLVIVGVIFSTVYIKGKSRIKRLKSEGEVLNGSITNIYPNDNIIVNGRHPFKLECQVIEPFSGETYLYSSGNINQDVTHLMGETVTVYVDKNDKSNYYVDTDELLNRYNMENKIFDYR